MAEPSVTTQAVGYGSRLGLAWPGRGLFAGDDAATDRDLRSPPSNHFEKLRGNLDGLHSIRVNKCWRLVFRWDSGRGEAKDFYLEHHSYLEGKPC